MLSSTNSNKLILVIDDSADSRTLLETLFRSHGWNVYTAANGAEALQLLRELSRLPDLILLDIEMPVMNGAEFRIEQDRDERLREIPVVVMSANDADQMERLHPDGVLTKPLRMNSLIAQVVSLL